VDMGKLQTPGYIYDLCRKLRQKSTDTEKRLWEYLRTKRLNGLKFRRQHPIGRYIADFYCREARLVIELDGKIHQFKDQKEYDRVRKEVLEMRGIHVLRVKNEEIEGNIDAVIRRILSLTSPPVSPSP
jgi:very-short-patch-repair endonuclease